MDSFANCVPELEQSRVGSQWERLAKRTWGVSETLISSATASGRVSSRGQRLYPKGTMALHECGRGRGQGDRCT
jgi:hypothetical protein